MQKSCLTRVTTKCGHKAKMPQSLHQPAGKTSNFHPSLNTSATIFNHLALAMAGAQESLAAGNALVLCGAAGQPRPLRTARDHGGMLSPTVACCHPRWLFPLCPGVETSWLHNGSNNLQSVCQARNSQDKSLITGKMIITETSGEICTAE